MRKGYIYQITTPSGKIYIGQTINLKNRISAYKSYDRFKKQKLLYNDVLKYNYIASDYLSILEEIEFDVNDRDSENLDELDRLEIYWIKQKNSYVYENENGLNLTIGGRTSKGRKFSDETRKKMSIAAKQSNNGFKKGYKPSKETTEKTRKANLGRKQSNEEIQKRVAKLKGKKRSLEAIEATASKLRGRKVPEEAIQKRLETIKKNNPDGIIPWNKGKKGLSEETREKQRLSHLGKKNGSHSDETKNKMRENALIREAIKFKKIYMNAIELIKKWEGCSLNSYPDPATGGAPYTIGYGNTLYTNGEKVKLGDKITQQQAEDLLVNILRPILIKIKKIIKVKLNENQLSSLASLFWNIGENNFSKSTVVKLININPLDPKIKDAWFMWNKANGKIMKGLELRREDEYKNYIS